MYVIVAVYFTTFESVIVHRNTCRPCYVSKGHTESSEPLDLLNGRVSAIPIESLPTLTQWQPESLIS